MVTGGFLPLWVALVLVAASWVPRVAPQQSLPDLVTSNITINGTTIKVGAQPVSIGAGA